VSTEDAIREEYVALVKSIGPGFHPDTPGDGYEPPLKDPVSYDRIVDAMFATGDPFRVGLDVFVEMGWSPLENLLLGEDES